VLGAVSVHIILKFIKTGNTQIVKYFHALFDFKLPSIRLKKLNKFLAEYGSTNNQI